MLRRTLVFSKRWNKLLQGRLVLKDFQGSLSHPANSQKKGKDECYNMEWIAHYGRCCSELHAYLYVCLCLWVHYSPLGPYLLTSPQHVRTLMICHHFWTWIRRFALARPQGHFPTLDYCTSALQPQDTQKYTRAHLIDWATSTDIKTQCDKHWSWCSPYSTNRCTMVSCCCFQMISLVMTLKGPVHYKTTEIHPYPAICYRPMLASSVIELKLLLSNTLYTAWNDSSS